MIYPIIGITLKLCFLYETVMLNPSFIIKKKINFH